MKSAQLTATSHLSLPEDSYVYHVLPIGAYLAAISSDDSLRLIDCHTLRATLQRDFSNVHAGVTSVRAPQKSSNVLVTSGRDAKVKGWDLRTGSQAANFETNGNDPYLSLACTDAFVAAGTELTNHQVALSIWDYRNPSVPVRRYVESHNDDITELAFHPTASHTLLSGSTDSLINIYDTNIAEEDEVLVSITNHGSSIHHAGFLSADSFFGLSHDESFSLYRFDSAVKPDEGLTGSDHVAFGDLRRVLNCEYVVDALRTEDCESAVVCAGSHSQKYLDLVPVRSKQGNPVGFDEANTVRLEGAHEEEIIRSVCFGDNSPSTVFTAGEDGNVKAWRLPNEATQTETSTKENVKTTNTSRRGIDKSEELKEKSGSGRKSDSRFKPY